VAAAPKKRGEQKAEGNLYLPLFKMAWLLLSTWDLQLLRGIILETFGKIFYL